MGCLCMPNFENWAGNMSKMDRFFCDERRSVILVGSEQALAPVWEPKAGLFVRSKQINNRSGEGGLNRTYNTSKVGGHQEPATLHNQKTRSTASSITFAMFTFSLI